MKFYLYTMKFWLLIFLGLFQFQTSISQISELSDEFNRTCNLYNWQNVEEVEGWTESHLESFDVNVTNDGRLTMIPWTTGWYENYRSTLLFKEVSGDFIFTTNVTATNKAEDDQPGAQYSLAGAMIRTPKTMTDGLNDWVPGEENYVFLSVGSASSNNVPQFEVKTTENSESILNITGIDTTTAIIRLVKIDAAIIVLYQLPNGSFQIRQRYTRPDMPDTLQVGLVTYTDWQKVSTYTSQFLNSHTINADLNPDPSSNPNQPFNPDLIGQFDYARFEGVNLPAEYEGLDFANPAQVSDEEILSLFSYVSTTNDLIGWKIWKGSDSNWNDPQNWSGGQLPTGQDSILIPDCVCAEVDYPILPTGVHTFSSLRLEAGGQLTIPDGSTLSIDMANSNSSFVNYGTILNSGTLEVINFIGKEIFNHGTIECSALATCNFLE